MVVKLRDILSISNRRQRVWDDVEETRLGCHPKDSE
jgi:hypothetical protein